MTMETTLHARSPAWQQAVPDLGARCADAVRAAFIAESNRSAEDRCVVGVVLVDDAYMRRLNREYRGEDRATDVLCFPSGDAEADGSRNLGDIFVAFETLAADAAGGRPPVALADCLSHMLVHGMLHLLGHDHEAAKDARAMEALEIEILAGLGIADPYARMAEIPEGVTRTTKPGHNAPANSDMKPNERRPW